MLAPSPAVNPVASSWPAVTAAHRNATQASARIAPSPVVQGEFTAATPVRHRAIPDPSARTRLVVARSSKLVPAVSEWRNVAAAPTVTSDVLSGRLYGAFHLANDLRCHHFQKASL
mmetsp:Transcript_53116/g.86676  ORF Transcript_53116/g.86676 Transcript_53116/m.86676 type:complete len:116 (-) Transcript_53116:781-1128(-)